MEPKPLDCIDYPDAELVFGVVAAVGTNLDAFADLLDDHVAKFGYRTNHVRISGFLKSLVAELHLPVQFREANEADRIESAMNAGDELRKHFTRGDFLALQAASHIASARQHDEKLARPSPHARTVHVIRSLKRPEEVEALRRIYGPGFYLVGAYASEDERLSFLTDRKNVPRARAESLMERDKKGAEHFGQRTRKTFELADVFIQIRANESEEAQKELWRFINLVFGHPFETPTPDEYGMFLAYSASLRSAQLGRQVGAAILSPDREVLAVGCNDVPAPGGGLYWPGEQDYRDHTQARDPNDEYKEQLAVDLIRRMFPDVPEIQIAELIRDRLEESLLDDITEFGRAVHAEMEAILSCSRQGISAKGATLYATTFPCHNCAKHVVGAGIQRVVYIEPYEKSRAEVLHADSLVNIDRAACVDGPTNKVSLEPFVGLGPRRFFDLFSMRLSSGDLLSRKDRTSGAPIRWQPATAKVRVRLLPRSYIEREMLASKELNDAINAARATSVDSATEPSA